VSSAAAKLTVLYFVHSVQKRVPRRYLAALSEATGSIKIFKTLSLPTVSLPILTYPYPHLRAMSKTTPEHLQKHPKTP
jgi:hypothetical protein